MCSLKRLCEVVSWCGSSLGIVFGLWLHIKHLIQSMNKEFLVDCVSPHDTSKVRNLYCASNETDRKTTICCTKPQSQQRAHPR